jgi:histidinol-phosphate aminotransferase
MYAPPQVIDAVDRVRGPFNLSAAAIAAGAAAVRDQAFVAEAVDHNLVWLERVSRAVESIGLTITLSVTNFVLIHFPDEDGMRANDADTFLTHRGYILRAIAAYGFPNALRMTIGSQEANEGVIAALTEFMGRK